MSDILTQAARPAAIAEKVARDLRRPRHELPTHPMSTRPNTSAAIADARIAEHKARGGGLLVTACASSLHRFRTRGEPAEDLVSLLLRSITG